MDARVFDKKRLPSRSVTEGPARAPHRSYLYAMDLAKEQIHQPLVGVEAAPGNIALIQQAPAVMKGVAAAQSMPPMLDAVAGTMDVALEKNAIVARRAAGPPCMTAFGSGALWTDAQTVGPALRGAVTHPGFAGETHVYADV